MAMGWAVWFAAVMTLGVLWSHCAPRLCRWLDEDLDKRILEAKEIVVSERV